MTKLCALSLFSFMAWPLSLPTCVFPGDLQEQADNNDTLDGGVESDGDNHNPSDTEPDIDSDSDTPSQDSEPPSDQDSVDNNPIDDEIVTDTGPGEIIYPWNATTAIVKTGESFEVWFDAVGGQTVNSVKLQGPYKSVHPSINIVKGNWEYDPISKNRYNTLITVSVPTGAPADRYDLVLRTTAGNELSKAGVKVVKAYKDNYHILHISDQHYGSDSQKAKWLTGVVEMANIIDPEIVFITGDNCNGTKPASVERLMNGDEKKMKGYHHMHAATFVVAGNHDHEDKSSVVAKSKAWNGLWGLQAHHFSYGNGRFMLYNNAWSNDWTWQEKSHENWLRDEGLGGNLRIAAGHQQEKGAMASWATSVKLDRWLVGHRHNKGLYNPWLLDGEPIQYQARALTDFFEFGLQRVENSTGELTVLGKTNTSKNESINPDADQVYGMRTGIYDVLKNPSQNENPDVSKWTPNLTLAYAKDNNGTAETNTATVVNRFDDPLPGAWVRFVMPRGHSYRVSQGKIKQAFDGDQFHIVDVSVDLDADSTTTVEISN